MLPVMIYSRFNYLWFGSKHRFDHLGVFGGFSSLAPQSFTTMVSVVIAGMFGIDSSHARSSVFD